MYKLLRSFLFLFGPEPVHYFAMNSLRTLCSFGFLRSWIYRMNRVRAPHLKRTFAGLDFPNPVGLAAGFDKNARWLRELECLGFGFVEIGTVTPLPQKGNDKPRLFRLPADSALINRMGFNNEGVKVIAKRLRDWKVENHHSRGFFPFRKTRIRSGMIIGGNIGKNKQTPNEEAWKDYEICFRELFDCVDYFVVNVSSPNTPGLRALQEKDSLHKILSHLQTINKEQVLPKPLFLKIAPDLSTTQMDDVIALAMEIDLDGLVISNTTISREDLITSAARLEQIGNGGLSGRPLTLRAREWVNYAHQHSQGKIPIIASGGIFNADDAAAAIRCGAGLVQVWTAFIYEGPSIVKNICKGL